MSVWKNLFTAVKGHVVNTAEAVEDTQLMTILDQQIRDAKTALGDARDERAKMIARRSMKQKAVDELNAEIERLTEGARKAKASGDMDLARDAVERIMKLQADLSAEQALLDQYTAGSDNMQATIKQTETKIENLQRQVESAKANEALLAAQKAASSTSKLSNGKLSGAVDSLKRLEMRQAEQAAMLEAADEMSEQRTGASLDARLASLDGPSSKNVDDLLNSL